MLTLRVAYNPHIHIGKNFIALVDAVAAPAPTVPYSKTLIGDDQLIVALPPPDRQARERLLERIRALVPFDPACQRPVLINPNASELLPHRRWMPERFAELIGRILACHDDVVVLITCVVDNGVTTRHAGLEYLSVPGSRTDISGGADAGSHRRHDLEFRPR